MRAINIFRRSENENRVWLHLSQEIHVAFDIRTKTILGVGGILAQMRRQVNNNFVSAHPGGVQRAEHVQMRAPRKVFSLKEAAHVGAKITAAACD